MNDNYIHRALCSLETGRPIFSADFTDNRNGDIWDWMQSVVSAEHECSVDDVGLLETDDGDIVTIDGLPAYRIEIKC